MDASRIGIVGTYWDFWEHAGDADLRQQKTTQFEEVVRSVRATGALAPDPLMANAAGVADAAARQWIQHDIDVLLVAISMAAPPATPLAVIDAFADLPVVIWTVQGGAGHAAATMGDIVADGGTVGTPMVTNVLRRKGRPFDLIVGPVGEPATIDLLRRVLSEAATASAVRRGRLARIGQPLPGYLSVAAEDDELQASVGIDVEHIDIDEFINIYRQTSPPNATDLVGPVGGVDPTVDPAALAASLRLAAALRRLDQDHGISAGTLNCHVNKLRYGGDPGMAACLALGVETSRGVPWTCTGDILTAIAMLVAKQLTGAAFYHEVEAVEPSGRHALLANSGEHDLAWTSAQRELRPNPWFTSDARQGTIVWSPLLPGPATMIAFTVLPGVPGGARLVTLEGEVLGQATSASPTSGGMLRFGGDHPTHAWSRWVAAGVGHHSALARGHVADSVAKVAAHLTIDAVDATSLA